MDNEALVARIADDWARGCKYERMEDTEDAFYAMKMDVLERLPQSIGSYVQRNNLAYEIAALCMAIAMNDVPLRHRGYSE